MKTVHETHVKTHEELHHLVGSCVHNMGVVHLRAGHYDDALTSFKKAISIRKGVLGVDHPDVAVSIFCIL